MPIALDRIPTHNVLSRNIFPVSMEGCVLYLPLWQEDMQGTPILSYDQYHHSCSVVGATWGATGRTFDKIDDIINCGNPATLNNIHTFTYEAWVYPISDGEGDYGQIMCKANKEFRIYLGDYIDCKVVAATTPAESLSTNKLTLNAWNRVMATYDNAGDRKIYLFLGSTTNPLTGVTYDTQTAAVGTVTADATVVLTVGNSVATDRTWDGIIGEVKVTSRVLALAEGEHNRQVTKWRYG